MNLMKRLRVLWPGCPLEKALDERKAAAEQMREALADMVETATTMTISHRHCERREQQLPVLVERRKVGVR